LYIIDRERELNRKLIYECRCDDRLKTKKKTKSEGSTRLTYTGFHRELEHLKIKTRVIDERFTCDETSARILPIELVTCRLHRLKLPKTAKKRSVSR
jgi:hypothetical protein